MTNQRIKSYAAGYGEGGIDINGGKAAILASGRRAGCS